VATSIPPNRHPPKGAPEGTVWFGGPVDEATATFAVRGDALDPSEVTRLLGCAPTRSARTGETIINPNGSSRVAREGLWCVSSTRSNLDIEDHLTILLSQLTSDLEVWRRLTTKFRAEFFCGLFLDARNRGFELPVPLLRQLADRGISIGFDIYAPEGA
jgi:Domain of unknown function (DUF4279)